MRKNIIYRLTAIAVAAVILCWGVSSPMEVYAAEVTSVTATMTLNRTSYTVCNTVVTKSKAGTKAKFEKYTRTLDGYHVLYNAVDVNGKNASNSVSFNMETGIKTAPYLSGYGKKGQKYRLKGTLSITSLSNPVTVRAKFTP